MTSHAISAEFEPEITVTVACGIAAYRDSCPLPESTMRVHGTWQDCFNNMATGSCLFLKASSKAPQRMRASPSPLTLYSMDTFLVSASTFALTWKLATPTGSATPGGGWRCARPVSSWKCVANRVGARMWSMRCSQMAQARPGRKEGRGTGRGW